MPDPHREVPGESSNADALSGDCSVDKDTSRWLDLLREWMLSTGDERLIKLPNGDIMISDVVGASADLCEFMAKVCEAKGSRNA